MSSVPNTSTILQVAEICQYLYNRAIYSKNFYNNQQLDKRRPVLLYMVRKSVQWAFNLNPSDPSLSKTGEYLFGLCAPFTQQALTIISNSQQAIPIITGPSDQTVNAGQNATFSVSVVSSLPVTYQWYDYLGNLIVGATGSSYTLNNAQAGDSGHTFFVRVTNAAGIATSGTAVLTVNANIIGYFSYGDIDPASALQSSNDPFVYQINFNIAHNANFSISVPSAGSNNKYLIVKVPIGEPIKTIWNNTPTNNGTIPDFNWQEYIQFGGFTYYYTRQSVNMDISQPLILS